MAETDKSVSLDDRVADTVVLVTKGIVGAAPFVGSLLAEVVGRIVPNQRIDRIADFVQELSQRLETVEQQLVNDVFRSPDGVDLFEDGLAAASRALSHDRRQILAAAFARVITSAEIAYLYKKRLLATLAALSDAELVMLHAVAMHESEAVDDAFMDRHKALIDGPAYIFDRPIDDQIAYVQHETLLQHLVAAGVVRVRGLARLTLGMSVPSLLSDDEAKPNYELAPLGKHIVALTVEARTCEGPAA